MRWVYIAKKFLFLIIMVALFAAYDHYLVKEISRIIQNVVILFIVVSVIQFLYFDRKKLSKIEIILALGIPLVVGFTYVIIKIISYFNNAT